jgi:hypothetical protein
MRCPKLSRRGRTAWRRRRPSCFALWMLAERIRLEGKGLWVSGQSDAACVGAIRGCRPELKFVAEWSSCAETTWDSFLRSNNLEGSFSDWDTRRKMHNPGWTPPSCFLYLMRCSTFDRSAHIYKVGITNCISSRLADHSRNPIAIWSVAGAVRCASRDTATEAEKCFLVAAALAGRWLGGEWIAGCSKSLDMLSFSGHSICRDRRRRVRAIRRATDGTGIG